MKVCARAIFLSFLIWFTAAAIPSLVAAQAQAVPQATINPPRIAFTETVFDWPGMGTYILRAVRDTEYDSIGGAILVLATIFVLVNLAVDMLYAVLDPRIRYGSAKD